NPAGNPFALLDSLAQLAGLAAAKGDAANARAFGQQVLDACHAGLLERQPLDAESMLMILATLYAGAGLLDDAIAVQHELLSMHDRLLEHAFRIGSEQRRAAFLRATGVAYQQLLTWIARVPSPSSALVLLLCDTVLRRKGLQTEALSVQRDMALGGGDPVL